MDANTHMNELDLKLPERPGLAGPPPWLAPALVPDGGIWAWLVRAAAGVKARWDGMRERRRVFRELEAMSDRELADVGISRYDIPRVFDPKFAEERASYVR